MISMIFKHLKTICKHKAIVCLECIKCGLIWRGLMHDNSKFGLTEFLPSAKYFQGSRSPIDAEKEQCGYSLAWLHHQVQKVGLAPVQREGTDYEFTTVLDISQNHLATVTKDRTGLFPDTPFSITTQIGERLLDWLNADTKKGDEA